MHKICKKTNFQIIEKASSEGIMRENYNQGLSLNPCTSEIICEAL